jgi:hypothetical protein
LIDETDENEWRWGMKRMMNIPWEELEYASGRRR